VGGEGERERKEEILGDESQCDEKNFVTMEIRMKRVLFTLKRSPQEHN